LSSNSFTRENGYGSISPMVNAVHTLAKEADHDDGNDHGNNDADDHCGKDHDDEDDSNAITTMKTTTTY